MRTLFLALLGSFCVYQMPTSSWASVSSGDDVNGIKLLLEEALSKLTGGVREGVQHISGGAVNITVCIDKNLEEGGRILKIIGPGNADEAAVGIQRTIRWTGSTFEAGHASTGVQGILNKLNNPLVKEVAEFYCGWADDLTRVMRGRLWQIAARFGGSRTGVVFGKVLQTVLSKAAAPYLELLINPTITSVGSCNDYSCCGGGPAKAQQLLAEYIRLRQENANAACRIDSLPAGHPDIPALNRQIVANQTRLTSNYWVDETYFLGQLGEVRFHLSIPGQMRCALTRRDQLCFDSGARVYGSIHEYCWGDPSNAPTVDYLDAQELDQWWTYAQNLDYGARCKDGVVPHPARPENPAPPATASLSANGTTGTLSVAFGTRVNLQWSSTNATNCSLSPNVDASGAAGTALITASTNTTYSLTCTGTGGSATSTVTVTILPPTVSLTANGAAPKIEVDFNSPVSLAWTSTGADTCVLEGRSQPVNGALSLGNVTQPKTYSISCQGNGGTNTKSVAVFVRPPAAPTVTLTANSANPLTVNAGKPVTLTWTSTNTPAEGTPCTLNGAKKAASGSLSLGSIAVGATHTITCTGPGGSVTGSVAIIVVPVPKPAVTANVNGGASATVEVGTPVTLSWTSTNATACTLSTGGTLSTSGSLELTNLPVAIHSRSITCTGEGGSAWSGGLTIIVKPLPKPVVTLKRGTTAGSATVSKNTVATLSYTIAHATSCSVSPLSLSINPSTLDSSGSFSTSPIVANNTTYTLSCTGPGGVATARFTFKLSTTKTNRTTQVIQTLRNQ